MTLTTIDINDMVKIMTLIIDDFNQRGEGHVYDVEIKC